MTLEQIESEMLDDTSSTGYIISGAGVKPFSAKQPSMTPSSGPRRTNQPRSAMVRDVAEWLVKFGVDFENLPDGLRLGATTLQSTMPTTVASKIAQVEEVVRVITDFGKVGGALPPLVLSSVNRYAGLGAGMVDSTTGRFKVLTRLNMYSDDTPSGRQFQAQLLAVAVLTHREGANAAMGVVLGETPGQISLPDSDDPCRWTPDDLRQVAALFEGGGVANADDEGVTVWLPLRPGATDPANMAQLRLRVSNRHPTLGNGLFCLLELPVKRTADHAASMAAELNHREARAVDAVPFVGAWTGSDATPPSFVCFLPNCCYHPGSAGVIASWMSVRAAMVGEWLGSPSKPPKEPRGARRDRKGSAG